MMLKTRNDGEEDIETKNNESAAFHWWRKAAEGGHGHSAYNLAVGHLSGYRTGVQKGKTRGHGKCSTNNCLCLLQAR